MRENEKLKQKLEEVITKEERLNRQANVLRDIMNCEATQLKKKVNMAQDKIRTLNKTIGKKKRTITDLETLFKHLKDINVLEDDTVFRLTNEFGNLLLPLLQNEKRNKSQSIHGRRYSEEVKRFAVTMHYYSAKAYDYCRLTRIIFPFPF